MMTFLLILAGVAALGIAVFVIALRRFRREEPDLYANISKMSDEEVRAETELLKRKLNLRGPIGH